MWEKQSSLSADSAVWPTKIHSIGKITFQECAKFKLNLIFHLLQSLAERN